MLKNKEILLLDIEASGLHSESYPIEIAVINLNNDVIINTLIKPKNEWVYWSEDSYHIHKIKRDELKNGTDPEKLCKQLNKLFSGKTIYSDGYQFDTFWLETLFNGIKMDFNIKPITDLIADKNRIDEFLYDLTNIDMKHRALSDLSNIKDILSDYI